jgi:hypothetical protein
VKYNYKRVRVKEHDSRFDWRTIFLKNSGGISSKRVIALIGVGICFSMLVHSYIYAKDIPEFAEVVFIGCLSLYGVDAIPSFWTKSVNKS